MVSADIPDWSREKYSSFWSPSKKLLKSIRDYQHFDTQKNLISGFRKKIAILRFRFWSVISGADIPLNTKISGGVLLPHPNGIVIHSACTIGPNCLIHQQVTIGVNHHGNGAPKVGGHVDIGAGAKIIGNIVIGNHVKIGANAVVVKDVPDYAIVAGIPAKIIGTVSIDEQNK